MSPIELIPDFIPILGYLDDLLIVPAGIWLAIRLIPQALMIEYRTKAEAAARPVSRSAAAVVILIWIAVSAGIALWFWRQASA